MLNTMTENKNDLFPEIIVGNHGKCGHDLKKRTKIIAKFCLIFC